MLSAILSSSADPDDNVGAAGTSRSASLTVTATLPVPRLLLPLLLPPLSETFFKYPVLVRSSMPGPTQFRSMSRMVASGMVSRDR